jgi:hypothetical protein
MAGATGREALASSVLLASGAYDDSSDEEGERVNAAADFEWDIDSDEEPEMLIWNADGAAQPLMSNGVLPTGVVTEEDMAASIAQDMERLNIGVRPLESIMMGVVVSFWSVEPTFILQTDEVCISTETMLKLCTEPRLTPFCLRIGAEDATADGDNDNDDVVAREDSGSSDSDNLAADEDDAAEAEAVPNQWIPECGYVNVLGVLYSQAPIIVGLHTEYYDIRASTAAHEVDERLLDEVFNNHGKRIRWLSGARESASKRSRGEDGEPVDLDESAAGPTSGSMSLLTGFAGEDSDEWTNRTNHGDVVCSFERERDSGKFKEVRLALSLHSPRMRAELQELLAQSRDTM